MCSIRTDGYGGVLSSTEIPNCRSIHVFHDYSFPFSSYVPISKSVCRRVAKFSTVSLTASTLTKTKAVHQWFRPPLLFACVTFSYSLIGTLQLFLSITGISCSTLFNVECLLYNSSMWLAHELRAMQHPNKSIAKCQDQPDQLDFCLLIESHFQLSTQTGQSQLLHHQRCQSSFAIMLSEE